jgi:glycosyltransferase involved in cell wall biosynthesis
MPPGPRHQIANLRLAPGELSFEARLGERVQEVWMRTDSAVTPTADAALATTLMPAMRLGGTLELGQPISPRLLRTQREFQAIQRAWSWDWEFGEPPLREVEVLAPTCAPDPPAVPGRVAALFSGGVDSWATVLANPDLTDLIFVRGLDLLPRFTQQGDLAERVEARIRVVAADLGLTLHVVETNLRDLSDPLIRWEAYCGCGAIAAGLFLSPLFERVLIAGDNDHATQPPVGLGRLVNQLWSTEQLEVVDDGGRLTRPERIRMIAEHPLVQRSLRVCWENPDGAYNCGRCRKCLMTMVVLEAHGLRDGAQTFPPDLELDRLEEMELDQRVSLAITEDVLDSVRAAGRPDLERPVEKLVAKGKLTLGLAPHHRARSSPRPLPTTRVAVVIPAWRQARYMAGAVRSALDQEISCGVGVVIVNDGCPDPETNRIGQTLRDADPDRVAYLKQENSGVSAARNAGIALALQRWPHVEHVFPLDADNQLSPHTLATLQAALEEHPEAAWASPALEFFGAEDGGWQVPGPYLPYRQLFMNQSDAGSLIRRHLFDAGFAYDETLRYGFEDWELFLHATLAGHRGLLAGRCGFRYRRRPDSMLKGAQQRAERLEAEIRDRHAEAFERGALTRREHAEAPRFGLVLCDRGEVRLASATDLEPQRLSVADYARAIAASPRAGNPIPAVTVFTSATAVDALGPARLAEALFQLQNELRSAPIAGLRTDEAGAEAPLGIAVRASAFALIRDGLPHPEAWVPIAGAEAPPEEALAPARARASRMIGAAIRAAGPQPLESHTAFLEYRHLEMRRTTFPSSSGEPLAITGAEQ